MSWARVARAQHARPWGFVVVALLLSIGALPLVAQLELDSDFQALLPEHAQSVRDLDEIRARFGGTSTLALAITASEGADVREARDLARALAPRIEGMDALQVASVDWNVADFERFVSAHRHLYADLDDLVAIRDALQERLDWERARANPFFIDLGDEAPPDPEAVIDRIQRDADEARRAMDRFPEGFYQHPERAIVFLFVRTGIRGGESGAIDRLIAAIEREADDVRGTRASASRSAGTSVGWESGTLRIDYGGDLMDVREENEALKEAVQDSTIVTVVLLLASIFVFFMRWRAAPLLLATLIAPTLVTFAAAELVVDYLNASSAFLGSIIVGNGVNSSVMWLGRYFEERRAGRDVPSAIRATHEGTWAGTFAAALAASLAYGSLLVTDYRGFRDFGFIGALGMMLCWVAAYAVLPVLVVITERWRPMVFGESEKRLKGVYGVLFAKLALDRPRAMLVVCAVLSIVSAIGVGLAVAGDPLEYDFRNLQAERGEESRVSQVNAWMGETVEETRTGSALAILAPTRDDVASLRAQLERYGENHPNVIGAVRTIEDLMPRDQDAKRPVIGELRRLLLEVRPYVSEARRRQIDEQLPPERVDPVRVEDLPASVSRPFMERDGTLGRLVFVEHAEGRDTWDGRYMIEWSSAVRSARTEDGARPAVAGVAVVFSDLLQTIFEDGPQAIGASFLATMILLLFTFRRQRERVLALVSMFAGVLWMTGLLAATGARLNFLNMIAFPITFGIGVEYGVNYVKRFLEEKDARGDGVSAVRAALEGAGGAVILCSLTTLIGYISLYTSANRALNSFGLAMSLGEVTCLISSLLALPAVLHLLESRARKGDARGGVE
ncbi:efflux RND transporter permease subunit [Sandaracinus amylolyticus]|uniref:efflux RND transporter permease subunit n=1 Tax=Sandaracinus amylolyticus TaxID=927083 RepID=UPI001EFFD6F2|nr:MMPL family transporter [Sandaracinus amylolyticus]UJR81008.1 Membrane protein, inferred for ABFAE pathway [Sandaracinus amylolyticus]